MAFVITALVIGILGLAGVSILERRVADRDAARASADRAARREHFRSLEPFAMMETDDGDKPMTEAQVERRIAPYRKALNEWMPQIEEIDRAAKTSWDSEIPNPAAYRSGTRILKQIEKREISFTELRSSIHVNRHKPNKDILWDLRHELARALEQLSRAVEVLEDVQYDADNPDDED